LGRVCHERDEEVDVEDRVLLLRCCIGDGGAGPVGLVVLRGRPAGGGRKPPRAAAVKSRGGERRGERRAVSASGVGQEGERERSTDDVSKAALDDIETGRPAQPGMSLAGACLLARRCPAWRWRELGPGSDAERGNLSSRARGRPVERLWPPVAGGRESSKRLIREGLVPMRGTEADRPVVAMKAP
jgi:hypothetical protein